MIDELNFTTPDLLRSLAEALEREWSAMKQSDRDLIDRLCDIICDVVNGYNAD